MNNTVIKTVFICAGHKNIYVSFYSPYIPHFSLSLLLSLSLMRHKVKNSLYYHRSKHIFSTFCTLAQHREKKENSFPQLHTIFSWSTSFPFSFLVLCLTASIPVCDSSRQTGVTISLDCPGIATSFSCRIFQHSESQTHIGSYTHHVHQCSKNTESTRLFSTEQLFFKGMLYENVYVCGLIVQCCVT